LTELPWKQDAELCGAKRAALLASAGNAFLQSKARFFPVPLETCIT
jgi:hypothetical protein